MNYNNFSYTLNCILTLSSCWKHESPSSTKYRQIEGQIDKQVDIWIQLDRWIENRWIDRKKDSQLDRQMDRQIDEWIDGYINRWIDKMMYRYNDGQIVTQLDR